MAIWAIPKEYEIDYSPNGDDVDSFSQKVAYLLREIFNCLASLHRNGAQAGLDGETTPFEIRINTLDNRIYMRDKDNEKWLLLGDVDNLFGITAEKLEAVRNGGGTQRILLGEEANMPTQGNSTFDLYIAQDTSRVFIWTGTTWRKFLSLNFADMLDYEAKCVNRDEVAYFGADKILRLDKETGKANVDITGSPEKLLGYLIDVQNLRDGHVLSFNAEKKKFVNLPNYELTKQDTTYQGGIENADKLIRVSSDGKIHADITGTAKATGLGDIPLAIDNLSDGEILVYHTATNSFSNESRSAIGAGKSLSFYDGDKFLTDYNGSASVRIDLNEILAGITTSQAATDIAHITRLVENLYLVLDVAGLNPGGYDRLSSNTFFGTVNDIDDERTTATLADGKFTGDAAAIVTKPICFVNEAAGETVSVNHAHLIVKHQNVADALIKAEISFRPNATFIKDEAIAVGDGYQQTVKVANTVDLTTYKFALYFDGVKQTSGFFFEPTTGEVTFTAPNDVIVSADYFYNWAAETFTEMEKTGTYPDYHNPNRATTQFTYKGNGGTAATIKLTLIQNSGSELNEITATGTGRQQVFKFAHQATASSIQVFPATVRWQYNEAQKAIVVTAPSGTKYQVSYQWKGKPFTVDSFACTFND